jgi:DNA invertase Pin-like site-specific DNA recombinase
MGPGTGAGARCGHCCAGGGGGAACCSCRENADLLTIEGATGKFLLQQMAAVAELEAGMISSLTKAALAAAKRRGVKLAGDRGARLTAKARAAGRAAVQERARSRALGDLAPTI